jgi:hypothetical protein
MSDMTRRQLLALSAAALAGAASLALPATAGSAPPPALDPPGLDSDPLWATREMWSDPPPPTLTVTSLGEVLWHAPRPSDYAHIDLARYPAFESQAWVRYLHIERPTADVFDPLWPRVYRNGALTLPHMDYDLDWEPDEVHGLRDPRGVPHIILFRETLGPHDVVHWWGGSGHYCVATADAGGSRMGKFRRHGGDYWQGKPQRGWDAEEDALSRCPRHAALDPHGEPFPAGQA